MRYETQLIIQMRLGFPLVNPTYKLRVLGRGAIQEQAVNELLALPEENPLRGNILELLDLFLAPCRFPVL